MSDTQDETSLHDGNGESNQAAVPWSGPPPSPPQHPVDDVLNRNREQILAVEGVVGVAHGLASDGADVVLIHVLDDAARSRLPAEIDGVRVDVVVVPGGFHVQS